MIQYGDYVVHTAPDTDGGIKAALEEQMKQTLKALKLTEKQGRLAWIIDSPFEWYDPGLNAVVKGFSSAWKFTTKELHAPVAEMD